MTENTLYYGDNLDPPFNSPSRSGFHTRRLSLSTKRN